MLLEYDCKSTGKNGLLSARGLSDSATSLLTCLGNERGGEASNNK